CKWRQLPTDFSPWSTVYTWFCRWRTDGTWRQLNDVLRPQVRLQAGRNPSRRASAVDSQSVKTTEQVGARGYDSSKQVKGHKPTIWVDSLGLLLAVSVSPANVPDLRATCDLLYAALWAGLTLVRRPGGAKG